MKRKCKECGRIIKRKNAKYCSVDCWNKPRIIIKICPVCKKEFRPSGSPQITCGNLCGHELKYIRYIDKWKSGKISGISGINGTSKQIKRYFREKYGDKCSICGWNEINKFTNKVPVQLEHKDGNWKNNKEDNLTLLCPNCHSLTETYCGALKQRGKGRPYSKWKLKPKRKFKNISAHNI